MAASSGPIGIAECLFRGTLPGPIPLRKVQKKYSQRIGSLPGTLSGTEMGARRQDRDATHRSAEVPPKVPFVSGEQVGGLLRDDQYPFLDPELAA
jgi:hypothetical protein